MTIRTRKLFGTFILLLWLIVYALLAMAAGGQFVVGRGIFFELPYYVIAGAAWLPVAMVIIRWMSKPDPV
ncbi:MAG: DUF2842 domain-containing protein [Phyllobacteriaceae bacterium]|nr:DUF2842 domain-containing protein [Phyllobacteriaceae bacterium]